MHKRGDIVDIKVNQVEQTIQTQQQSNVQPTDDTFRFMLASNIEDRKAHGCKRYASLSYFDQRFHE